MSESFTIVRSHPALLKYVEHLQAQNSDALGFLPRRVFEQSTESGRLFLGLLDGDPCGYMLLAQGIVACCDPRKSAFNMMHAAGCMGLSWWRQSAVWRVHRMLATSRPLWLRSGSQCILHKPWISSCGDR